MGRGRLVAALVVALGLAGIALGQAIAPSGGGSTGAVTASGSPASTDVAVWSSATAVTGDSHFTWASNVLQLGTGTVIRPETGALDIRTQPGNKLTLQRNTNTGDEVDVVWQILAGTGRTNQLTVDGSSSTNPATITASGGDSAINISLVPKGASSVVTSQGYACTGSTHCGTITLSTGTGTATVVSGCKAICSPGATAVLSCTVSSTTLTATGTGSDTINYFCF